MGVAGIEGHLNTYIFGHGLRQDNQCRREFEDVMKLSGLYHTTSVVFHPSSNGQRERCVGMLKRAPKKMKSESGSVETKMGTDPLAKFLLSYRTWANLSTGEAPCTLMMNRRIRTRLDSIKPIAHEALKNTIYEITTVRSKCDK